MDFSTKTALTRFSQIVAIAAILGACSGGDGSGSTNAPPAPPAPPPPPPPPFNAVFSEIQDSVFTPTCAISGCHTGAGAPQGLQLDEANSFALLVGVASSEVPTLLRVAPGDADNSYLIQKLEGNASVGAQMPLGGPPLPQDQIDTIRQWIIDGATDDRPPAAAPIRVSSLSVVPGSVLDSGPTTIIAGFDRELDASTVNANTFLLEGSGGDTTFGDGNEVAIVADSISVPTSNPQTAVFDLSSTSLADDLYRVQLLGSGPSLILDLDANALDGDFSGAFPSGDGTAGGDFSATFAVTTPTQGAATLDDIQAAVFTPLCSGCHSGNGSTLPGIMDLSSADASFANLVGVSSLQVPALSRVAPNDPDNSYLVQKLTEDPPAVGARMPQGGAPLDPAAIADIRDWIAAGAPR